MFSRKTKCSECLHWVDKEDCQRLEERGSYYFGGDSLRVYFYCPEHKKTYDRIDRSRYFRELEVDVDGVPLGFAPKKR